MLRVVSTQNILCNPTRRSKLFWGRDRGTMDSPNAFIGKATQPTATEIAAALGKATELWNQLIDWLTEQGATVQEWSSVSPKYGWSLKLKVKKRTIIYLGPSQGCFRISFALGDKAIAAARASALPKNVLKIINEAPRYAEGTGVRMVVKSAKDLPSIKKLALIKMAN